MLISKRKNDSSRFADVQGLEDARAGKLTSFSKAGARWAHSPTPVA